MHLLYLLSVWLHILAAAAWIGGMIFLVLVLVPLTRQPEFKGAGASLLHWTGMRFRWIGWICLTLLVTSGTLNASYRGFHWADLLSGQLWQGPFGQTLGIKLMLVSAILLLSALHDFFIGPRATTAAQTKPNSTEAMRLRCQASWIGRLNLLLALAVVALGVILARGWPW